MKQIYRNIRRNLSAAAMLAAVGLVSLSASADNMYVSHTVTLQDYVYPYTGFSTTEDVPQMSVAVKLTKEMLAPYTGAKVSALHIGWSGVFQDYSVQAEAFVRKELNEGNSATTSVSLSDYSGWNVAEFDEPYEILENDELFIGYVVDMKAGVYGPCTLTYGSFDAGTHFISRPDVTGDDGLPEWIDLSEPGLMEMACPIMIVAELDVEDSGLADRVLISDAVTPVMMLADTPATGGLKIKNTGSNEITSLTLAYSQPGKETMTHKLELSQPVGVNSSAMVSVPVYVQATGETVMTVTEVNGNANGEKENNFTFPSVVIPSEIASKYTRRPLMEYIASENDYRSGQYDIEIVTPALEENADKVTRIDWHTGDQFQLGLADDKDHVLDMLVEVAKGDSTLVYLPNMMLDRDRTIGIDINYAMSAILSPMIGIVYSPFMEVGYEYAIAQPTFAGVDVKAVAEDGVVTVDVSAEGDLSVLPEGEKLALTVVLVEDGVESDSQEFPGGTGEAPNPGHITHNNLVRQCLTDIWGDPVEFADGKMSKTFTTELDYDNKVANMRAVAFLNRQKSNGMWERTIINSAESPIATTGVSAAEADKASLRPRLSGRDLLCSEGASMKVYSVSGGMVPATSLESGIYVVVVTGADGSEATFKMVVK